MADNPLDFIPEIDLQPDGAAEILAQMKQDYEDELERQTGVRESLPVASRDHIILSTEAVRHHQVQSLLVWLIKQNFLKHATGAYLDNLAAIVGVTRLEAAHAVTTVRFTLSAVREDAVTVPAGTRVSSASKVFFQTTAELTIPTGELDGTGRVEAVETGAEANGFEPGALDVLVDPIPFVAEVANVEVTQGGADIEDDDNLRLRVYEAPHSLSTAGPEEAYRYWVRSYSQTIEDVKVTSPDPGVVDIKLTLTGGELPTESFLDGLQEFLRERRPLTDSVDIGSPEVYEYELDAVYYIARSKQALQADIIARVEAVRVEYLDWQDGAIGRDLNPDQLRSMAVAAGAKRLEVAEPTFVKVPDTHICKHTAASLTFGGVEGD